MKKLSLFSGIGLDDIASEAAGIETMCFVEKEPFCQRVLKHHWPNVSLIGDIHDVTEAKIRGIIANSESYRTQFPSCDNSPDTQERFGARAGFRSKDGDSAKGIIVDQRVAGTISPARTNYPLVDIVSGGPPCQPASVAGKRRGAKDDRWLWPETFRVIRELQPTWIVLENPAGIGSLDKYGSILKLEDGSVEEIPHIYSAELLNIIDTIEEIGYEVKPVLIPACAVNAPHRRDRVFVVANSLLRRDSTGGNAADLSNIRRESETDSSIRGNRNTIIGETDSGVGSDPPGIGLQGFIRPLRTEGQKLRYEQLDGCRRAWSQNWIEAASRFCSLDAGSPDNMARPARNRERIKKLKALGNANPPQQYYPIYKAIVEIERAADQSALDKAWKE